MSDVNANINLSIDAAQALSQLRALQSQITTFNESLIASNTAAAASQTKLNSQMLQQVGAIKGFSTHVATVESGISRLSTSIDKNKLSLGEYFRYGTAASGKFGQIFSKEHSQIMNLAESRVKRLQTQYVALGEAHNGMQKAMAVRPLQLFNADAAISVQRGQLFNKLLRDGSTSMVNFGKNTQWAGRQLMVGFTLPLVMFGTVAAQQFMKLDKQARDFKRVYGDAFTGTPEINRNLAAVRALGLEYTKYGISMEQTMNIAASAAAAGMQNQQLQTGLEQTLRLATVGQIDYQQALMTTISLQNAFKQSNEELAPSVDFIGAVANQTVLTVDDMTKAIPRVAPIIHGLGGDVKDLAVMLVSMREGGISAEQGANALKSGLASMINPTKAAVTELGKYKISMSDITSRNKGDVLGMVQDFAKAIEPLDKFARQQVLAKVFGKYQFARMGALFDNINQKSGQTANAMKLLGASTEELAALSKKSLDQIQQSTTAKFEGAIERLKVAIAPIGEMFLKAVTPLVDLISTLVDKFNALPDAVKGGLAIFVGLVAVAMPSVLMLVGLIANLAGNFGKLTSFIKSLWDKVRGLSGALKYQSDAELDATAAAASLEGATSRLTGSLNAQREAVVALAGSYATMANAANAAAARMPQAMRGPVGRMPRKFAVGGFVAGSGNKDSEPALLMPGEFVVNKKAAQANGPLLSAMNSGTLRGYATGTQRTHLTGAVDTTANEALAGNITKSTRLVLQVIDQLETVLGRSVSSISKVSNFIVELGTSLNQDMRQKMVGGQVVGGVSQSRFASEFGAAGIDKYRTTAALAKVDFASIAPHLEILDKEIIKASSKFGIVGDLNIDQITKEAFSKLPADSKAMLSEIEGLTTQYNNLRITVQQLDAMSEADLAKLKAAGITHARGADADRQYITAPGIGTASTRARQESRSWGRSYRRSPLFGLSSIAGAEAGGTAVAAAGSAAGVNSPSKITKEQGHDIDRGMAQGIREGIPEVEAAAEEMGRAATQTGRGNHRRATRPQGPPDSARLNYGVINNQNVKDNFIRNNPQITGIPNDDLRSVGEEAKKTSKGLKDYRGKIMGATTSVGMLAMGMSFMDGAIGEMAQKVMIASFAIDGVSAILPMLANPVGLVIAALVAAAGGFWAVKSASDGVADKSKDMAKAMFGSTESMNKMADYFGKRTYSQQLADNNAMRSTGVTEKQLSKGQEFVKSDAGQKLLADIKSVRETMGSKKAAEALSNQLGASIMSGAIGTKMAHSIAAAVGGELNDTKIAVDASAKIASVVWSGQKIGPKERLKIFADIMADATDINRAMTDAGMVWDGSSWFAQISMEVRGQGTADLTAANLSQALISGQDSLNQLLDKNRLDFQKNIISADEFLKRQKEILDTARKQGLTWEGVRDKFRKAYPGQEDITDNIAQPMIDKFMTKMRASLGDNVANGILSGFEQAEVGKGDIKRGINLINPQNVRDVTKDLHDELDKWKGELAQTTDPEIKKTLNDRIAALQDAQKELKHLDKGTMRMVVALDSNQLSPDSLKKFLDNKKVTIKQFALKLGTLKDGASQQILQLMEESGGSGKVLDIAWNFVDNGKGKDLQDLLLQITRAKGYEVDVSLVVNGQKDLPTLKRINNEIERFRAIKSPITKKALTQYWSTNFDATFSQIGRFLALPAAQQKIFMTRFITTFETRGSALGASAARANAEANARTGSHLPTNANQLGSDISAGLTFQELNLPTSTGGGNNNTQNGAGGGGGGKGGGGNKDTTVKDWLKKISDELGLYISLGNAAKKLKDAKKNFNKIMSETTYDKSFVDNLRKMGLSELMVADLIGQGYESAKKIADKLGKTGLLKNNARMLAGARGKIVSGYVGQARISNAGHGAIDKLQGSGLTQAQIAKIASDETESQVVMSLTKGTKGWKEYVAAVQKAQAASEAFTEAQDPMGYALENSGKAWTSVSAVVDTNFDAQTHAIEMKYRKQISGTEDAVKAKQKEIDAIQKEIDAIDKSDKADQRKIDTLERQKDAINRQIDALQRLNDLDQRKIDDLKREDELRNRVADGISHELELMSRQETEIKAAYDARIKALDDVIALNQHIIDQQRSQLDLSKALSEGDVYAAAQAAQAMQEQSVTYASEQARKGLENGMQNQIDGLRTAGGLTREQAEAQINAIKDQSYQTSLQIRDIEDQIFARNQAMIPLKDQQQAIDDQELVIKDAIAAREQQITDIQVARLEPAQEQLDSLNDTLTATNDKVEAEKKSMQVAGVTYEQWQDIKTQVNDAFAQQNALHDLMQTAMLPGVQKYGLAWAEVGKTIAAAYAAQKNGKFDYSPNIDASTIKAPSAISLENMGKGIWADTMGTILADTGAAAAAAKKAGNNYGGISVLGFASGGSVDTVPAMLSPGEFIMSKGAVNKYGKGMLASINNGTFSTPTYSNPSAGGRLNGTPSVASINAPVYNTYSVNVVAKTNATADEIANAAVTKIRNIDNANIRRVSG